MKLSILLSTKFIDVKLLWSALTGVIVFSATLLIACPAPISDSVDNVTELNDADSVAADKSALEIGYAPGEDETGVTQNVTLSTSGKNGSTITWSSDNTVVISETGTVTRPDANGADTEVVLTATIQKGTESDTKSFTVTVLKETELNDADSVAADKSALEIGYAPGEDETGVTQNVTLSTSGKNGSTITWSSDNTVVISETGTVNRPDANGADTEVVLTATIQKGTESDTKSFTVTVLKETELNDADSVAADKSALEIGYAPGEDETGVTQNITLSTSGKNGSTITWSSDNTVVISETGTVTRPDENGADTEVVLTATIQKGTESDTKSFTVTVLKETELNDADSVAADKAALDITYSGSDTAASVTLDITLPLTGDNGSTITWESQNTAITINGTTGSVTRPDFVDADVSGDLIATITKGSASDTKIFSITVIKLGQTDISTVAGFGLVTGSQSISSTYKQDKTETLSFEGGLTLGIDFTVSITNRPTNAIAGHVSLNSNTGVLTVTNEVVTDDAGDYTVTVSGTGKYSGSIELTFTLTVDPVRPGSPGNLQVTAGDTEVSLTWTAPADNGGADVSSYTVYWSDTQNQATGSSNKIENITTTSTKVTGLTNTNVYYFVVTATNSAGEGAATTELSSTPQLSDANSVAADKAALDITYSGSDTAASVTLDITLPLTGDNGSTITWESQNMAITINGTTGSVTRPDFVDSDVTGDLIATITKGSASDTKTFGITVIKLGQTDISAVAGFGLATGSQLISSTYKQEKTETLSFEGGLTIGADFTVSITNRPTNAIAGHVSLNPDTGVLTITDEVVIDDAGEYTVTVSGTGNYSGSVVLTFNLNVNPVKPGIPGNFKVTAGNATAYLTWTAPADNGGADVTFYTVYWSETPDQPTGSNNNKGTTLSLGIPISDLTNGTTYYFKVTATNSAGEGNASTEVSATPVAPPINAISLTETTATVTMDVAAVSLPTLEVNGLSAPGSGITYSIAPTDSNKDLGGVSIDSGTGVISITTTMIGKADYTITATGDDIKYTGTQTTTLTVKSDYILNLNEFTDTAIFLNQTIPTADGGNVNAWELLIPDSPVIPDRDINSPFSFTTTFEQWSYTNNSSDTDIWIDASNNNALTVSRAGVGGAVYTIIALNKDKILNDNTVSYTVTFKNLMSSTDNTYENEGVALYSSDGTANTTYIGNGTKNGRITLTTTNNGNTAMDRAITGAAMVDDQAMVFGFNTSGVSATSVEGIEISVE